jgi:2Fe-2S iron-sulfur cluster binding domain
MTPNPTVFEVVLLLPNEERSVEVGVEQHIWDAAFTAGVVLPALCHQGRCLTCAGRVETTGEVDQSDSVNYYPQDRGSRGPLYEFGLTSRVRCGSIEFRNDFLRPIRRQWIRAAVPESFSLVLEPSRMTR